MINCTKVLKTIRNVKPDFLNLYFVTKHSIKIFRYPIAFTFSYPLNEGYRQQYT